jgi:alkylation response protein AidB-like acyl-CoA dehydrogenase
VYCNADASAQSSAHEVTVPDDEKFFPESLAGEFGADADRETALRITRAWIDREVPVTWREAVLANDLARLHEVRTPEAYREWYPRLGRSGLVAPDWPARYGGLGLSPMVARVVLEELRRWRLARLNIVGLSLAGPVLLERGTEPQRRRLLPAIVTNAEPWCQLFSEPSAGSDLAGLATRATREGDAWRVTGQKVWTSFARDARWGLLLARTDPDVPKHAGLTAFVCDMTAPEVEVRPLRKITGDTEFSEVFIDGLLIDDDQRVGDLGDGWRIAQEVLKHERQMLSGSGGGGRDRASGGSIDRLIERARRTGASGAALIDDDVFRDRLAALWIESNSVRWTNERAAQRRRRGLPAIHPSAQKLLQSEHNQRLQHLGLEALGESVVAFDHADRDVAEAVHGYLRSRGDTIAGGTSEIQRNIVAERALGLPREDDDRTLPWRDIPRGPS